MRGGDGCVGGVIGDAGDKEVSSACFRLCCSAFTFKGTDKARKSSAHKNCPSEPV